MENNEYNSYVEENLDKRLRYGTRTRRDNNIPIYLCDAEELLNRVLEKDKIGIVPDYTITKYQESNFQDEKIVDFVHLEYEKEEEMIKLAEWKELEMAYLL